MVKWISQLTSDQSFWVRVLVGAQCYNKIMIGKIRNLVVSIISLLVIIAGVLSVLVVLDLITVEQLWGNLSTLIQVGLIILVCTFTLIMLLRANSGDKK